MIELGDQIVSAPVSIGEVVRALERATIKLVVLTVDDGTLARTISDGDIRRALLAGASVEDPVDRIPWVRGPIFVTEGASIDHVASVFEANPDLRAIVVVDGSHQPVALEVAPDVRPAILMSPPHLGTLELEYVSRAFTDNWIAPAGPNIDEFEGALSQVLDRDAAVAVSSGTAALHLALRVLGVEAGDRVYVSDLTFVASIQPVLYQAGVPVLIDCEPDTWNMSPQALARRLRADAEAGCLPKAIIVVHLYGQSSDMDAICALADRYDVPIVEDAAESLGAEYRGRPSGSHGLLAAYSFNGNKIITTAGGGALLSNSPELIDRARYLSTQGRDHADHYQHEDIAYNYRMSNVLAGIGIGQLQQLSTRVEQRRAVFQRYVHGLGDLAGISFQGEPEGSHGNRWLTVIRLDPDSIPRHPYGLMTALRSQGIESRPAWKPMSMQPLCRGFEVESHDPAGRSSPEIFLQSLCLPSGSALADSEQERIIAAVREFVGSGA